MNTQSIWASAYQQILRNHSNPDEIRFWLDQLQMNNAERSGVKVKVVLSAPNSFYANFINDSYRNEIEQTISSVLGEPCELTIHAAVQAADEVAAGKINQNNLNGLQFTEPFKEPLMPPSPLEVMPQALNNHPSSNKTTHSITGGGYNSSSHSNIALLNSIDPALNFDNYIVGPSNQFAYASAICTAEKPAIQFNPLFIYGPPAVGKTHLLHAIGNHIKAKNPHIRAYFASAENFVNEFIESIQHKNPGSFRSKYRDNVDLLLIDDVQFIVGKERSEEEFIHTFNTLHSLKKMIVLTSDKAPKDIDGLEERIRTRFEMGLVADIRPPEIETRIAILKARAETDDIYLPDDVATFLGTYIKDTVRNLHGALVKIQQFAALTGSEITLDLARQVLQQSIPEEGQEYTVEMILSAICKYFNIKIKDLKGVSRAKVTSLPRQIAMYLIRRYTQLGHREVGQIFDKDHSTVVHAIKKIEAEIEINLELKRHIEAIREQL